MRRVVTIGGTDPTGGAGIAQDLRTFAAFGVWGMPVVTAVTVQNTTAVRGWHRVPAGWVGAQFDAVVSDVGIDALKTGMVPEAYMVAEIAAALDLVGVPPLVVDPVFRASVGERVVESGTLEAVRDLLLPRAILVTPNADEARALTGVTVTDRASQLEAAFGLLELGARYAVVTGGHLDGTDVVAGPGGRHEEIGGWIEGARSTHGTGCVFSAAAVAAIAMGADVVDAVHAAKRYVMRAIENGLDIGKGVGPVVPPREV